MTYSAFTSFNTKFGNNEDCGIIRGDDGSSWNDVNGNSYFGFIVEYDEPWNPELKISAPKEVLPGETFDVKISVSSGAHAVNSAAIDLVYDNSLLETVPADFDENGEFENLLVRNLKYKENTIRFSGISLEGIDWNDKVFTVTFRVKENTKRGGDIEF